MSTKIVAARLATSAGVTTVITRASSPGNIARIFDYVQGLRSPASGVAVGLAAATASNAARSQSSTAVGTPQHELSGAAADSLASSVSTLAISTGAGPDPSSRTAQQQGRVVPLHTRFVASRQPIRDRHFWLLHGLAPRGTLYIDQGAYRALVGKAGLLPVGVVHVEGEFAANEAVRLVVVDKQRAATPGGGGSGTTTEALVVGTGGSEVGRALVNYSAGEIARIKGRRSTDITELLGYADSEYVAQREYISFFHRDSRPATPTLPQ